jgi:hypothetical protein
MGCCCSGDTASAKRAPVADVAERFEIHSDDELDLEAAEQELPLLPPSSSTLEQKYGRRSGDAADPGVKLTDTKTKTLHPKRERSDGLPPGQLADGRFKLRGPSLRGTVQGVSSHPEASLYRVIDGKSWAYYNDAPCHVMHVATMFTSKKKREGKLHHRVRPLDTAVLANVEAVPPPAHVTSLDEFEAVTITVSILPGETARFCRCTVERAFVEYSCDSEALPHTVAEWKTLKRSADEITDAEAARCGQFGQPRTLDESLAVLRTATLQRVPFLDLLFRPSLRALVRPRKAGSDDEDVVQQLASGPLAQHRAYIAWRRPGNLRSMHTSFFGAVLRYPIDDEVPREIETRQWYETAYRDPKVSHVTTVQFIETVRAYYGFTSVTPQPNHDRVPRHVLPVFLRIHPGRMGTAWLSSAAAALAETPVAIARIVPREQSTASNSPEPLGGYVMKLCVNGWWTSVAVDDTLPCLGYEAVCMSSMMDDGELWPALLEKAVAKCFGSYTAIGSGDAVLGTVLLSGFPSHRFHRRFAQAAANEDEERVIIHGKPRWLQMPLATRAAKTLFDDVCRWMDGSHELVSIWEQFPAPTNSSSDGWNLVLLQTCAVCTDEYRARLDDLGLSPGFAYRVLEALSVTDGDSVHRLVKIRNPWPQILTRRADLVLKKASLDLLSLRGPALPSWASGWGYHSPDWRHHPRVAEACGIPLNTAREREPIESAPSQCCDVDATMLHSTMWLSWEQALHIFVGGGVSMIRGEAHEYRAKGVFEQDGVPTVAFEIRPNSGARVLFTLSQDDRMGKANPSAPESPNRRKSTISGAFGSKRAPTHYSPINLTIYRPDVRPGFHKISLTSTQVPHSPIRVEGDASIQFLAQREVSLEVFAPCTDRPYLIVPRCAGACQSEVPRPYVLTMHSDTPAAELRIRCVRLPAEMGLFADEETFFYDPVATAEADVPFQTRRPLLHDVRAVEDVVEGSSKTILARCAKGHD